MRKNPYREIISKYALNESKGDVWVRFLCDYGDNVEREEYESDAPDNEKTDWETACYDEAKRRYREFTNGLKVEPLKAGKGSAYKGFYYGFVIDPADIPTLEKRIKDEARDGDLINKFGVVTIHTIWLNDKGHLDIIKQ